MLALLDRYRKFEVELHAAEFSKHMVQSRPKNVPRKELHLDLLSAHLEVVVLFDSFPEFLQVLSCELS